MLKIKNLLIAGATLALAVSAQASTYTWTGDSMADPTDWQDGDNWTKQGGDDNTYPGIGDIANFSADATISNPPSSALDTIDIGVNANCVVTYDAGGTISLATQMRIRAGSTFRATTSVSIDDSDGSAELRNDGTVEAYSAGGVAVTLRVENGIDLHDGTTSPRGVYSAAEDTNVSSLGKITFDTADESTLNQNFTVSANGGKIRFENDCDYVTSGSGPSCSDVERPSTGSFDPNGAGGGDACT